MSVKTGDEVRVVEHDDPTRQPRKGGAILRATVTEAGGIYVRVRYHEDEQTVAQFGSAHHPRFDAFYKESGWRAWDGMFRWRLDPDTEG